MVGPSAELVSEQAGLAVCDTMVGPSAELDFTQAGLADCGTVVDVCDVVVCGGDTVIEGLCDGDMVSGESDTVGCCVDTVLSGAVSGGLCDLDRVSGGGDAGVCCVDTVLSGAVGGGLCDLDRVSRGVTVVGEGDVSVAGGGDTVVFGVDESVCSVRTSMAAGELDVCGVGVVVSDEAGEPSRVDLFVSDGVGVGVGDCLSVVADEVLEWHGGVTEETRSQQWCLGQGWLHLVAWTGSFV